MKREYAIKLLIILFSLSLDVLQKLSNTTRDQNEKFAIRKISELIRRFTNPLCQIDKDTTEQIKHDKTRLLELISYDNAATLENRDEEFILYVKKFFET